MEMEGIDLELSKIQDEFQLKLDNLNLTRTRQSLSLFDLVIEESNEKIKETEYEEKLKNELTDWCQLLKKAKSDFVAETESEVSVPKSILLPEQIQYLEEKPDLQKFINDSRKFQIKAYNYLHSYAETDEMKNELAKYCIERLEKVAVDNVDKHIYG